MVSFVLRPLKFIFQYLEVSLFVGVMAPSFVSVHILQIGVNDGLLLGEPVCIRGGVKGRLIPIGADILLVFANIIVDVLLKPQILHVVGPHSGRNITIIVAHHAF